MKKNKNITTTDISEKATSCEKKDFKYYFGKISYAIIPFLIFVAVLGISYFGNQLLYSCGVTKGSNYPEISLDSEVPLIPWFVYFYYLTFPLGILTFFVLAYKDRNGLYTIFLTLCISFAISGIVYFFGQTVFTKPEFTPDSFTDRLVVWTWGSTNPVNCFPSQHCFMAFAMILACCVTKKISIWYKLPTIFCSIMIVLSTIFIRQHFIMDIFASFDIMLIVFVLVYFFKLGPKLNVRCQKIHDKYMAKRLAKQTAIQNTKLQEAENVETENLDTKAEKIYKNDYKPETVKTEKDEAVL